MKTQQALRDNHSAQRKILFMAMELSNNQWKLAFGDGHKQRQVTIEARNLAQLGKAIANAKEKLKLAKSTGVISCYEAGRDGFWIHRYLLSQGIENHVVDSSSIEVNRRARKLKTDAVDAQKLLTMLLRYVGGEKTVWHVVRVPSVEQEDARRLHRELERLKKESTQHCNRVKSLLIVHGIRVERLVLSNWEEQVNDFGQWNGQALPADARQELIREGQRLSLVREQIRRIEAEQRERLQSSDDPMVEKVRQLMNLRAFAQKSAWVFVMEFFGWREFKNRRQVGALAGLTGTAHQSGESEHEQGISKAGNRRVRAMIIEIGWAWLRLQPKSQLSRWYQKRFGAGGKRLRRIGIVALARRLLIDIWRFLEHGIIPEGAKLKPAAAQTR
jgi:transposase